MTSTEILSNIMSGIEQKESSSRTRYLSDISIDLCDYLSETLDEHQRDILSNINDVCLSLENDAFEDGVLLGMELSRGIAEIVHMPGKIFEMMRSSYPPVEQTNGDAVQMRIKYLAQKRKREYSEKQI